MNARSSDADEGWSAVRLGAEADEPAPDGSQVRLLVRSHGASMAHFTLDPGATSEAVAHRAIEEFWYVVSGEGRMWLSSEPGTPPETGRLIDLVAGVAVALAPGTGFQFRSIGSEPLEIVGVAVPPWPGDDEAYPVNGFWAGD